jgi:hypothetical protein
MPVYTYQLASASVCIPRIYAKEAGVSLNEKSTTKTSYKDSKKNSEEVQLKLYVFTYKKMKKGIGVLCR